MPGQTSKKPHHHGDLREALIAAGLRLLEEGGPEALTLRRAAALAGVSHAAPAHHFAGLPGLRRAIADEGFRRFRNYMVDARLAGEQSPRGQLRSICRGYLHFARDNRALFALMFGFSVTEPPPAGVRDIGSFSYTVLRETCAPFVPEGTDPEVIEAQVWSLIHGFTSLYLAGRFRGGAAEDEDGLFAPVMALLDRIGIAP
jgi:AcrR family transcriptional regulator